MSAAPSLAPPLVRHVAVIMDGNGRWAKSRGLPRLAGHHRGMDAVRAVVRVGGEIGLEHLTIYAFSSENWRRPSSEVSGLMNLFRIYIRREISNLIRDNVQVRFIGDRSAMADDLRMLMDDAEDQSAHCGGMRLNIAVNYGGRAEIAMAARRIAAQVAAGDLTVDQIDEDRFGAELMTSDAPDPDIIIRTGGVERVSNFLLWQLAYSEFVFVEKYWPDFNGDDLRAAIAEFETRDRRFGAVSAAASA